MRALLTRSGKYKPPGFYKYFRERFVRKYGEPPTLACIGAETQDFGQGCTLQISRHNKGLIFHQPGFLQGVRKHILHQNGKIFLKLIAYTLVKAIVNGTQQLLNIAV